MVIGGGDTAIDAARVSKRVTMDSAAMSRRLGAEVTILYRRTRTEMPAIEREIEEALEEGVKIEYLAAPLEVLRGADGQVRAMVVQRMQLGEPDASGRRAPVPIEGDTYELPIETIIVAVSQEPDLARLGSAELGKRWMSSDEWGRTGVQGIWTGGDNIGLGLATISIGQGRKAAESIHAALRGEEPKAPPARPSVGPEKIKMEHYEAKARAVQGGALPRGAARQADGGDRLRDHLRGDGRRGGTLLLLRQVLRLREVLDVLPGRLLREDPGSAPRPLLQGQARAVRRLQEVR